MKENIIATVAVVALAIAGWALFNSHVSSNGPATFGATAAAGMLAENYIPYVMYNGGYNSAKDLNITGGITFGSSGTTYTKFLDGTCAAPTMSGTTLAASSSGYFACPVTGVASGDIVQIFLPTAAGAFSATDARTPGQGFWVNGQAATSSNYVEFTVANGSGAATTTFTHWIANTKYTIYR